jgi:hypothetical protein
MLHLSPLKSPSTFPAKRASSEMGRPNSFYIAELQDLSIKSLISVIFKSATGRFKAESFYVETEMDSVIYAIVMCQGESRARFVRNVNIRTDDASYSLFASYPFLVFFTLEV